MSEETKAAYQIDKEKAEAELDTLKAKIEKQKLEQMQQLELLKAKKDLISDILPKGETKPLEGKIETDEKSMHIAEQVSYSNLNQIAEDIRKDTNNLPQDAKVLIVDSIDFASGQLPLVDIRAQMETYGTQIVEQTEKNQQMLQQMPEPARVGVPLLAAGIPPAALASLAAIPSAISLFADAVGYFRTDYSIKGQAFNLKQQALVAAVASRLRENERKVYVYNFYEIADSKVVTALAELHKQVLKLRQLRNQISMKIKQTEDNIKNNKKKIEKIKKENANESIDKIQEEIESEQKMMNEFISVVSDSDTIISEFISYSRSITIKTEGQAYSLLAQAVLREKIKSLDISHLLYLSIVSGAGVSIIRRSRLQGTPSINYMGGTVVSYILAKIDGELFSSGTKTAISSMNHKLRKNKLNLGDVLEPKKNKSGPSSTEDIKGSTSTGG